MTYSPGCVKTRVLRRDCEIDVNVSRSDSNFLVDGAESRVGGVMRDQYFRLLESWRVAKWLRLSESRITLFGPLGCHLILYLQERQKELSRPCPLRLHFCHLQRTVLVTKLVYTRLLLSLLSWLLTEPLSHLDSFSYPV